MVGGKIFGVGLNKTGTTTLGECAHALGLRATSCQKALLRDVVIKKDLARTLQHAEHFDLFEDWPWPLIYRELDHFFPGSKFILTTRIDEQAWYESLCRYSISTHPWRHSRKLAYGHRFPQRHGVELKQFYLAHNQSLRTYFKERPQQFLEVCWEKGDGWPELCTFLEVPLPDLPFPHANRLGGRKQPRWWWRPLNRLQIALGL